MTGGGFASVHSATRVVHSSSDDGLVAFPNANIVHEERVVAAAVMFALLRNAGKITELFLLNEELKIVGGTVKKQGTIAKGEDRITVFERKYCRMRRRKCGSCFFLSALVCAAKRRAVERDDRVLLRVGSPKIRVLAVLYYFVHPLLSLYDVQLQQPPLVRRSQLSVVGPVTHRYSLWELSRRDRRTSILI